VRAFWRGPVIFGQNRAPRALCLHHDFVLLLDLFTKQSHYSPKKYDYLVSFFDANVKTTAGFLMRNITPAANKFVAIATM
jgi:hypothetical protein